VKFVGNPHGTRILVTEQVVASLGTYLGAPVPPPVHVDVSQALITDNALTINGAPATAGIHHGSRWEADCSQRLWVDPALAAPNAERFAVLCVLYAWVTADDRQLIYRNQAPRLVFSVDHGHFLPGGPGWSASSLASAPAPIQDADLAAVVSDRSLFAPYVQRLAALTPEVVAAAVARAPASWGIPEPDLIALADFVVRRAAQTVQLFTLMMGVTA
jgi:hypothetical protein